jgi:hypothetical protein
MRKKSDKNDNNNNDQDEPKGVITAATTNNPTPKPKGPEEPVNIDVMGGRSRSRVPLERAGFSFLSVGTTPTCRLPLRLGLPCESTSAPAPVDEFVAVPLVVLLKATGAMVSVNVTVVDGVGVGVAGSADGSSEWAATVVMGKEMGKEYGW